LMLTIPLTILASAVPESFYAWVFGIKGIAIPLRILSPGMIAGAISSIIAHHLSAIGLHKWNARTSGIGFTVLICVGWFAVPTYGVAGAAVAASAAYVSQAAGLIFALLKEDPKEN
jgi:O-antigen/teichoic acid export membrane protein